MTAYGQELLSMVGGSGERFQRARLSRAGEWGPGRWMAVTPEQEGSRQVEEAGEESMKQRTAGPKARG